MSQIVNTNRGKELGRTVSKTGCERGQANTVKHLTTDWQLRNTAMPGPQTRHKGALYSAMSDDENATRPATRAPPHTRHDAREPRSARGPQAADAEACEVACTTFTSRGTLRLVTSGFSCNPTLVYSCNPILQHARVTHPLPVSEPSRGRSRSAGMVSSSQSEAAETLYDNTEAAQAKAGATVRRGLPTYSGRFFTTTSHVPHARPACPACTPDTVTAGRLWLWPFGHAHVGACFSYVAEAVAPS